VNDEEETPIEKKGESGGDENIDGTCTLSGARTCYLLVQKQVTGLKIPPLGSSESSSWHKRTGRGVTV